jgi:hypothetical protein
LLTVQSKPPEGVTWPVCYAHRLSQWAPDVGGHVDELVNASTAGMVE